MKKIMLTLFAAAALAACSPSGSGNTAAKPQPHAISDNAKG